MGYLEKIECKLCPAFLSSRSFTMAATPSPPSWRHEAQSVQWEGFISTVPRSFDTFAATTFCYANYSRLPSLDACQISPTSKQNIKQAWTSERTVKRPSTVGAFARNPSLPQTGLKQRPQYGAAAKIPRLSVAIHDHPLITCFIDSDFFPRLEAFCQSLFVHLLGQYRLPHCYSHSYAGPCRIKFKRLSNRLLCILAACSKIVAHSCRFLTVYDPRVT